MSTFNYMRPAELFPTRNKRSGRSPFGYKRFDRAADAIRFAVEELPPELLHGAHLEVDEERFDGPGIRRLYDSPAYPLSRRAAAGPGAATSKNARAAAGPGAATSKNARAAGGASAPTSKNARPTARSGAATSKTARAATATSKLARAKTGS